MAILSLIFLFLTLSVIVIGWVKHDAMILSMTIGFASAMNLCPVLFHDSAWVQGCFVASIVFEIVAVVLMVILRKKGIYIEKKYVIENNIEDVIFKTSVVFMTVALVFYFSGLIGHAIKLHEYKQNQLTEKVEMVD